MPVSYYTHLPAANVDNALVNFQPLASGLDSIREQNNTNRNALLKQQEFDTQAGERDYQHGRDAKGDARQQVADYGKQAMAVDQMADGPQRQAIWNSMLDRHQAEHPGPLSPEEMDHRTGPKLMAAQAGMYIDPNDKEMARLKIAGAQSELDSAPLHRQKLQAEIKAMGQKDALNEAISGMLKDPGAAAATAQPSTGQPPVQSPIQPQNFNGTGPQQNGPQNQNGLILASDQHPALLPQQSGPQNQNDQNGQNGLILASDQHPALPQQNALISAGQPPQNGPQNQNGLILAADKQPLQQPAVPPAAPAAPAMINTPMGQMSADRAKRMGMALALGGKGDAGKLLTDAANAGSLSKAAETPNDKEEMAATSQLATLDNIKRSYDAKFLNIPNRFQLWGNNLAAKFGQLSPQDQQDVQAYATFRQSAWHNLNRVLKDLSGTAVTENEMQRQLLDQPNPGQGIFDGDSPQEFEAKLKGEMAFAHSAVARARYLRNQGFKGKPWEAGIAVEDMPGIINKRGAELEQQLKQQNPNADPTQLKQALTGRLKQEFGI